MKKGLKKAIVLTLGVLLSSSLLHQSVSTSSTTVTYSGQFKSTWHKVLMADEDKGRLEYGFDTFLFNEDYAKAYHTTNTHYARLDNGSGEHIGQMRNPGETSKIEAIHSGKKVKYYFNY